MSYSLFLSFKSRIHQTRLLAYFAARKHYKCATDRVSYENRDTGVYFFLKLRCGRDFLLRKIVRSAEFEINYYRPSFFGVEVEPELAALVGKFQPGIDDPQMHGMGEGPYSGEAFLKAWNFGNLFSVRQAASNGAADNIATMPANELHDAWEWNYRCAEQRNQLNHRCYVPTIFFRRIDGRASRVVIWGEGMPILLPKVDYVLVAREGSDAKRVGLASWSEVLDVAKRAGLDTSKEPLDLAYLVPPPLIADWVANIPLTDLAAIERLYPYQILDEELITSAREGIERDQGISDEV